MSNNIVNVLVSQLVASAPSTLQRTGAIISQGGTTLSAGVPSLLTQASDLTPLLHPVASLSSLSWSAGTATATAAAPHDVPVGDAFLTTIAGATPANYNGQYLATATSSTAFTYALASDGGTSPATGSITYTPYSRDDLVAAVNEFFAQGSTVPIYVLELEQGTPAQGVTALSNYLASPAIVNGSPLLFYAYYQPDSWDIEATAVALANANAALTSKVYFFQKTTLSTYSAWSGIKSVVTGVKAASAPITEESLIAMFWRILSYNPSLTQKLSPTAFAYQLDVTPFGPTSTQAATLKTNSINYIDTGAEGGISNTILKYGKTMDGKDFSYWYAVDWLQIQLALILANTIINGANSQPPLVYNQPGINTLQSTAQGKINDGISFGVVNNATPVAAIPFATYTAANPSDYAAGIYNGLSVTCVPQTGFDAITFNLTVSNFGTA